MPLFIDPAATKDYVCDSERLPPTKAPDALTGAPVTVAPGAPKPGATTFKLRLLTPRQAAELADLRNQDPFPVGSYVLLAIRYGIAGWQTPGVPAVRAHPHAGLSDDQIALLPYDLRVELERACDEFQIPTRDDLGKS